ncbi:MAG: hypothetical protein PHF26_03205, partial [Candidatus Gracilibacteria bacterium]|nr:hypothetical protein [Candidatus Gracilibacteria bacterium]
MEYFLKKILGTNKYLIKSRKTILILFVFLCLFFGGNCVFAEDNGTGSDVGTGSSIGEKLIETPPVLNNDENIFKMFSINRSMESIQSSSNVPRNGLVAEYLFEGNANDTSGKGNNGWLANVRFMNGVEGQSSSFGGYYNPGHIRVTNNSSLQLGNELSNSFWVKFKDYSGMVGR